MGGEPADLGADAGGLEDRAEDGEELGQQQGPAHGFQQPAAGVQGDGGVALAGEEEGDGKGDERSDAEPEERLAAGLEQRAVAQALALEEGRAQQRDQGQGERGDEQPAAEPGGAGGALLGSGGRRRAASGESEAGQADHGQDGGAQRRGGCLLLGDPRAVDEARAEQAPEGGAATAFGVGPVERHLRGHREEDGPDEPVEPLDLDHLVSSRTRVGAAVAVRSRARARSRCSRRAPWTRVAQIAVGIAQRASCTGSRPVW